MYKKSQWDMYLMPVLRNALLMASITKQDLNKFDSLLNKVFDICEKYLGKDE